MMHTGDGAQKPPDVPQMEVMQVRSQGQSASEPQVLSAVTYWAQQTSGTHALPGDPMRGAHTVWVPGCTMQSASELHVVTASTVQTGAAVGACMQQ